MPHYTFCGGDLIWLAAVSTEFTLAGVTCFSVVCLLLCLVCWCVVWSDAWCTVARVVYGLVRSYVVHVVILCGAWSGLVWCMVWRVWPGMVWFCVVRTLDLVPSVTNSSAILTVLYLMCIWSTRFQRISNTRLKRYLFLKRLSLSIKNL